MAPFPAPHSAAVERQIVKDWGCFEVGAHGYLPELLDPPARLSASMSLRPRFAAIAGRALGAAPILSAAAGPAAAVPALAQSAMVFGAANTVGFGISVATGSHVHLDLIGTGVFAVAAGMVGGRGDLRQSLSSMGVAVHSTV